MPLSVPAVRRAPVVFSTGSGSPVITSAGTASGTALVWIIWSANRTGAGAQLQAFNPIPVNGALQQVYSASIGTSTNYSMPGVGNNGDLYVGTRGGTVIQRLVTSAPGTEATASRMAPAEAASWAIKSVQRGLAEAAGA